MLRFGVTLKEAPSDFSRMLASAPDSAMGYSSGCRTTFHHRYHLAWAPKYRFKVLHGEVRLRVREIIRQVRAEMGVTSPGFSRRFAIPDIFAWGQICSKCGATCTVLGSRPAA